MFKSTFHSNTPATFNLGLLIKSTAPFKDKAKIFKFLEHINLIDLRVGACQSTNKQSGFFDIDLDYAHLLFDCINFDRLFNLKDQQSITRKKIEVFNSVATHIKLWMIKDYEDALIGNVSDYQNKTRTYIKPMINRCIKLNESLKEMATREEGVIYFWRLVDHYIFINKRDHELDALKTFIANA